MVVDLPGRPRLQQGMVAAGIGGIVEIGEVLALWLVEQCDEPLVSTTRLESYRIFELQCDFVVEWIPPVKTTTKTVQAASARKGLGWWREQKNLTNLSIPPVRCLVPSPLVRCGDPHYPYRLVHDESQRINLDPSRWWPILVRRNHLPFE